MLYNLFHCLTIDSKLDIEDNQVIHDKIRVYLYGFIAKQNNFAS